MSIHAVKRLSHSALVSVLLLGGYAIAQSCEGTQGLRNGTERNKTV